MTEESYMTHKSKMKMWIEIDLIMQMKQKEKERFSSMCGPNLVKTETIK